MSGENRNSALDCLKGIACIGVVFIHATFPGKVGEFVSYFARFAVPVFFMISGYYSYANSTTTLLIKLRKIFVYTCSAILLYAIHTLFFQGKPKLELFGYASYWMKMIVVGNFDVFGAFHLWFLMALLYAYVIIYVILKWNLCYIIGKITPLLFVLRLVVCTIVESNNMDWYIKCNFLICALPYMFLGNYLAHNKKLLDMCEDKVLVLSAVIGFLWGLINIWSNWKINFAEIGVTVYSVALFILSIRNPKVSYSERIQKLGKTYSLYVYIIHVIVLELTSKAYEIFEIEKMICFYVKPIVILSITIMISYFIRNVNIKIKRMLERKEWGKI